MLDTYIYSPTSISHDNFSSDIAYLKSKIYSLTFQHLSSEKFWRSKGKKKFI